MKNDIHHSNVVYLKKHKVQFYWVKLTWNKKGVLNDNATIMKMMSDQNEQLKQWKKMNLAIGKDLCIIYPDQSCFNEQGIWGNKNKTW